MDAVDPDLLEAARADDHGAFERLVAPYRRELRAHCYRMLGAVHDADDALQDTLIGAWRGLGGFEGRSSLRAWLYRIATNACLRMIRQRPQRLVPLDFHPPLFTARTSLTLAESRSWASGVVTLRYVRAA